MDCEDLKQKAVDFNDLKQGGIGQLPTPCKLY